MTNIKHINKFLLEQYPYDNNKYEDYIGIQLSNNKNISNILLCLDVTNEVVDYSIKNNIDLIISHHPLFFGDKKDILSNDVFKKKIYDLLKENNIGVISHHMNVDFSKKGLSLEMLNKIIDSSNSIIAEKKTSYIIDDLCLASTINMTKSVNFSTLTSVLKSIWQLEFVKCSINHDKQIDSFYVASGASGYLVDSIESGSTLVTGEVKWHEWIAAKEKGINLIEIGHGTEEVFIDLIKSDLNLEFGDKVNLFEFREEINKLI